MRVATDTVAAHKYMHAIEMCVSICANISVGSNVGEGRNVRRSGGKAAVVMVYVSHFEVIGHKIRLCAVESKVFCERLP